MEESAVFCSICLEHVSWPKARPKICKHTFCYHCISTWVKRRSECPLCKRPCKILMVISQDGKEYKTSVKRKTSAQYQRETDEEHYLFQETEDITVTYARCQVCNLSKDEHLLLLCDGIIGQNVDGSSVRCNAACHCYCLPEKFDSVPDGDWFCPFCTDVRATQESVYNGRYARRKCRSSSNHQQYMDFRDSGVLNEDQPGPSRISESFQLRRYIDVFISDEILTESSSDSVKSGASDDGMENDSDFSLNSSKDVSDIRMIADDDADWDNQDDMVLATDSDIGYDPAGMTKVTQRKRHKHRRRMKKILKKAKKRKDIRKKSVKHRGQKGNVSEKIVRRKNKRRKNMRKNKSMTGAQKRLAEAIGLDLLTGRQKKRERNVRHSLSNCILRGSCNTPMLSIRSGDDLDVPIETRNLQSTEHLNDKTSNEKPIEETDLITSIMLEQAKTLAPARYQRILRDGTISESEQMIKQRKKLVDEKIVAYKELFSSEGLKVSLPI
ncbi:unnamed protein product [Cercopithifilaria johnstoni]|uniref:RING-type domain-containing protein n=1 Tax=Cercopithifilaria johnstoni TaxID=2874296 RepID=A0A8J2PX43_9BILA|nr:unnamed protein product [Cercopithifilaria johnstoni]